MLRNAWSHRTLLSLLLIAFVSLSPVMAQAPDGSCSSEKAREFDFWVGEWDVYSGDKKAGTNRIQPILGGCVLQETWSGSEGSAGSSFNFYNPQTKKWHQFWVWRRGTTLELAGSYRDGRMILEGRSEDGQGRKILNRITWFDLEDGTVRQHWEQSRDKGKTWQTSFDGLYRKKTEVAGR